MMTLIVAKRARLNFGKNPMHLFGHFKDSAVALSASIMLLATGFFAFLCHRNLLAADLITI
jgi:hypothetical protein